MTSSLVGSEMCIRDRSNRAVPHTGTCFLSLHLNGDACGHRRVKASGLEVPPCLLYTSDAADDM
eukprot:12292664-Prorocentrum_lima.AAC.1